MVSGRRSPSGFVLIAVVFLAFVVSLTMVALARLWGLDAQREKERDLLGAGRQFSHALASYALATPEGGSEAPGALEQLVLDSRVEPPRRHLRKLPLDPMTGSTDWGTVRTVGGAIIGVHSTSHLRPLAPDNLWPEERTFAGAGEYSQWIFGPAVLRRPLPLPRALPTR